MSSYISESFLSLIPLPQPVKAPHQAKGASGFPAHVPSTKLQSSQSNLQPPTSNLQPPTSNLQPPTSKLQPPSSNLQPPTSKLPAPTSNLQPPNSQLQPPTSKLPAPSSQLPAPSSKLQAPSSFILHPSSFILHPSSFILHPSYSILLPKTPALSLNEAPYDSPGQREARPSPWVSGQEPPGASQTGRFTINSPDARSPGSATDRRLTGIFDRDSARST